MKGAKILLCAMLLLTGCSGKTRGMDHALQLRTELLKSSDLEFCCTIVADYGDQIYTFEMECNGNQQGDIQFVVLAPDSISGISGEIEEKGGRFTFDDKVVFFPLLAEGQLSPVSAPWTLMKALRSGYIRSIAVEGELLRLSIDNTLDDDILQTDIWIMEDGTPVSADILYDGKRILSLKIENFELH